MIAHLFCRQTAYLVLIVLVISNGLIAQESLSTLRGTVVDASGTIVPGVAVSAREVLTNIVARTVQTDGQGNFEMPGLKTGNYQVGPLREKDGNQK